MSYTFNNKNAGFAQDANQMIQFTLESFEVQCIYPREIEVEKSGTWFSDVVQVDVQGTIPIEVEWSDDLLDPTSDAFKELLAKVQADLLAMFQAAGSVLRVNVQITGFQQVSGTGSGRRRRSGSTVVAVYTVVLQINAASSQAQSANVGQAVMAQVSSTGILLNLISAASVQNAGNGVTFPTPPKPDNGVTVSNTGTLSYEMNVVPGEVGETSQMTISPLHGITGLGAT